MGKEISDELGDEGFFMVILYNIIEENFALEAAHLTKTPKQFHGDRVYQYTKRYKFLTFKCSDKKETFLL